MSCLAAVLSVALIATPGDDCRNGWTDADTTRAWVDRTLIGVDWLQTRWIVEPEGQKAGFVEGGPLLSGNGRNPSKARIDTHFAVVAMILPVMMWATPPKYRAPFQYVVIGVHAGVVGRNIYMGVKLDLD